MPDKFNDKDNYNSNSEELNNFQAENNPAKDFFYFLLDLVKTGLVVFVIAFSLRYFAVQPFVVDGESMMPNFVNNEYILAEKVSYLTGEPKRGDVIVFRYPGNPNVSYIKRIIGLPGETITIADNSVKITSKNNSGSYTLNETYIPKSTLTLAMDTQNGALEKTLGNDEYFVMGDNRQHSSDSREWGILPKANIIGRTWLTILPFDKFGIQKHVSYSYLPLRSLSFLISPNR